jgi:hypothetical protein
VPSDTVARRIDLAAVERSLRDVQQHLGRGHRAGRTRDPLDDPVLDNMLAGYAHVDSLVAAAIDVFAIGYARELLELNTLVLCGSSPARREAYAGHLRATEQRFYEGATDGIQDLVEWHALHEADPACDRAAGVYVRLLSRPQLFVEGNHRTGALLMSYVLLREGRPPFVLSPGSASIYFECSAAIRDLGRHSPAMRFRGSGLRHRISSLLVAHADPRHLLGGRPRRS